MLVLVLAERLSGILQQLTMVFLLAPVRRLIARSDTPSTIIPRISARLAEGSLFMPLEYDLVCLASSPFDRFQVAESISLGFLTSGKSERSLH